MASNSSLRYMYRDTHNYKWDATVTFAGTFTTEQHARFTAHLLHDRHFVPDQVDLPDLLQRMPRIYEDDASWRHEFLALEPTGADPDDPRTISEFIDELTATTWTATITEADRAAITHSHQQDLRELLDLVRATVPAGTRVTLTTSDQNTYGFTLHDVTLPGGQLLSDTDPDVLTVLQDAGWPLLANIDWDGIVGEDKHGMAVIIL